MNEGENVWYVMRSIFKTELKTKAKLDQAGIRTYIPMSDRIQIVQCRKNRVRLPVVRNLMFVYSNLQRLAPFLAADSKFQFTYRRGGRQNEPLIVPDNQMQQFIKAVEHSEKPLYFTPSELHIEKGTKIRIIGGPLDGVTGVFMKVKGSREKRLVVEISDTLVVAVEVKPDLIEVLSE